jgi:hypothetical protein
MSMNAALENEVRRLMGVARVHAEQTLARPADKREAHLARYRIVWNFYAAVFTESEAERECFTGSLDRATRDLMAKIESNDSDLPPPLPIHTIAQTIAASTNRAPEPQHRPGEVITLEELRPILRKIIGK